MSVASPVVSSDEEPLVLVDELDQVVGYASKGACHDGDGLLHRAFSVFVFNSAGQVLLQQRAEGKRLWPLYWSNSCCSHPRRGESIEDAAARRVVEELQIKVPLIPLYQFRYQVHFANRGSEHELCKVLVGMSDDQAIPNRNEVAAWRYEHPVTLTEEIERTPHTFTPWLKMEWKCILGEHTRTIEALLRA